MYQKPAKANDVPLHAYHFTEQVLRSQPGRRGKIRAGNIDILTCHSRILTLRRDGQSGRSVLQIAQLDPVSRPVPRPMRTVPYQFTKDAHNIGPRSPTANLVR